MDILGQYDDLMNNMQANASRKKQIQDITDRYLGNISRSSAYQRDQRNYLNAPSFAESRRLDYEQQNRQYSQRVYMGNSNG